MKGWWGGGYAYGLWIGVLVASGFSVIPVPSSVWKNEFKLSGKLLCKVRLMLPALLGFSTAFTELISFLNHGHYLIYHLFWLR